MNFTKRKVSCTFKRDFPLDFQERIYHAQVQTSKDAVPTTPQFSAGWKFDPTISIGGGVGPAVNVDLPKEGGVTITYGAGIGGKAVSTDLSPVFVIYGSIPYCW
jgi:hypothetical protein